MRDRETRKSISVEDTFFRDIGAEEELIAELAKIADRLWTRVEASHALGKTVTLKIKLGDFRIMTRARSLPQPPPSAKALLEVGVDLLRAEMPLPMGARLLGLGLSNLLGEEAEEDEPKPQQQLTLELG